MPGVQGPIEEVLPDWPEGPLDYYRKQASFDWRKLKVLIEGEECIRFKAYVWRKLAQDPLFSRDPWQEIDRMEARRITFLRMKKLIEYEFITEEEFLSNPMLANAVGQITGQFDWALCSKKFLAFEYFISNSRSIGSDSQNKFMEDVLNFDALGCICITELTHGSNTKGIQTRATYDQKTDKFILHTPNIYATKIWSGNLAKTATHASVFAQLYTSDGECKGLHTFLVPVRDPKTLLPYKGVKIGDMGPKLGLNGLDNGFVTFDNYPIERGTLLNRNVIFTDKGEYQLKSKKTKPQGITLGILSLGRVSIILQCITNMQTALVISIRFSGVRRQFGNASDEHKGVPVEEWRIMEYQTHQWRLFPYVAACYVLTTFYTDFFNEYINFFISNSVAYGNSGSQDDQPDLGAEIHALSCVGKAISAFLARDSIQESRECCGGYGYLKASRLGELRDDHDPNCTYEGDNNVILQQTSNYIMKKLKEKLTGNISEIKSPLGSLDFLDNMDQILTQNSVHLFGDKPIQDESLNLDSLLSLYQYLVSYLSKVSFEKLQTQLESFNYDQFCAKNESQVYFLRTLSIVYFDCELIRRYRNNVKNLTRNDVNLSVLLDRLGQLYGFYRLEPNLSLLYEANYFLPVHRNALTIIKEKILKLCNQLKTEMVSLVDVFAPPDDILNSSLGYSDGRIYDHIFDALSKNRNSYERAEWYKEFTENKPKLNNSKL